MWVARLIMVAGTRLWYGPRLLYADVQPGNFLFMPDGRLGFIDFGCCHQCSDDDFDYLVQGERAMLGESRQAIRDMLVRGMDLLPKHAGDERRMSLLEAYCDWLWEPMLADGPYDFSVERLNELKLKGIREFAFTRERIRNALELLPGYFTQREIDGFLMAYVVSSKMTKSSLMARITCLRNCPRVI